MNDGNNQLDVIRSLSEDEHPPRGGLIVRNRIGTGRLCWHSGPFNVPPFFGGTLIQQESFLVLDDVPLIRRHSTDCPSGEQLLQVGCGSQSRASEFAAAINSVRVSDVIRGNGPWLQALKPLFAILPSGSYRVGLKECIPTDGTDKFFWNAYRSLRICFAMTKCPDAPRPAEFLVPTQVPACFRAASMARAEAEFREKPGIAVHLSGMMSALLDGHHRALCAARAKSTFPCIILQRTAMTEIPPVPRANPFPDNLDWLRSVANDSLVEEASEDQATVDQFVAMVEAVPDVDLPAEYQPADLQMVYPDVDAAIGLDLLGGEKRQIPDEVIEQLLQPTRPDHPIYLDLLPYMLKALFTYHDIRAIAVAIRVAIDPLLRKHWELAIRLLATRRCDRVDDFFVDFLCAPNEPERPELKRIVDEYFRTGQAKLS